MRDKIILGEMFVCDRRCRFFAMILSLMILLIGTSRHPQTPSIRYKLPRVNLGHRALPHT